MTITVLKPGLQTTVQSRPRVGLRHQGVPGGGAADPVSLALANRLVGNPWDSPGLEATLVGPTLRVDTDCAFAIAGAPCEAMLGDRNVPAHETVFAKAGDVLHLGPTLADARAYIAFAGGLESESILGSASTNLQAGFGGHEGRALQSGDVLWRAGRDAGARDAALAPSTACAAPSRKRRPCGNGHTAGVQAVAIVEPGAANLSRGRDKPAGRRQYRLVFRY